MHDKNAVGTDEVKATVAEVNSTKNEMSRVGSFAPPQWTLGRLPRVPASQLDEEEAFDLCGLANVSEDSYYECSRQASLRASARKSFAEQDVGSRAARAVLCKAAPLDGQYSVGDAACFC